MPQGIGCNQLPNWGPINLLDALNCLIPVGSRHPVFVVHDVQLFEEVLGPTEDVGGAICVVPVELLDLQAAVVAEVREPVVQETIR